MQIKYILVHLKKKTCIAALYSYLDKPQLNLVLNKYALELH